MTETKPLSRQAYFEKVWAYAVANDFKPAFDKDQRPCYITQDGIKDPIGCLLSDAALQQIKDNKANHFIVKTRKVFAIVVTDLGLPDDPYDIDNWLSFFDDLQACSDYSEGKSEWFKEHLEEFAIQYKLIVPNNKETNV